MSIPYINGPTSSIRLFDNNILTHAHFIFLNCKNCVNTHFVRVVVFQVNTREHSESRFRLVI